MQFKIKIQCDNAVFQDDAAYEIARILASLAQRIESLHMDANCRMVAHSIHDTNGNRVGEWSFTK